MAFQNFYATKLQTAIGASDTSIVVQTPPTALTGRLVLEPRSATQREIISYTGVSGTTLTGVTRGLFGTTAKPHSSGALTEMNFLAQDYQDLVDAYDNFVATNNDWRSLIQVPTMVSSDGQRQHKIRYTGVDYTGIIPVGSKLKIPRTGTTPTASMSFNAASSQYAIRAAPSGITFTDDFTVEAWINLASYGAAPRTIIARSSAGNGFALRILTDGRLGIYGGNGGSFDDVATYQSIPLGKWTHVAATLDASGAVSTMYIDGVGVTNAFNPNAISALVQSGDLRIGATHSGEYFDGQIANVRVWSTVRTAAQIRDNMNQETPASTTGLVAHFKGNGSWNDSSANGNHVSAINSAVNNFASHPYSATEYAIATKVEYTGGNTDVTVFTGSGCLPNETLGATSYSNVRSPIGFPAARNKWQVQLYAGSNIRTGIVGIGVPDYMNGTRLDVPVGAWRIGYNGTFHQENAVAAGNSYRFGVTTTAASLTGQVHKLTHGSELPGVNLAQYRMTAAMETDIQITAMTSYHLFAIVYVGNSATFRINAESNATPFTMYAECAYL